MGDSSSPRNTPRDIRRSSVGIYVSYTVLRVWLEGELKTDPHPSRIYFLLIVLKRFTFSTIKVCWLTFNTPHTLVIL